MRDVGREERMNIYTEAEPAEENAKLKKRISDLNQRLLKAHAREAFSHEPWDWTEVLKVMTKTMEEHPFWPKVQGTPLENDLPVRASKVFFTLTMGSKWERMTKD